MDNHEKFMTKIVDNNGVLRISIPIRVAEFAGYQVGDSVKVWMRKAEEEDKEGITEEE